jgi:hypothetical protein
MALVLRQAWRQLRCLRWRVITPSHLPHAGRLHHPPRLRPPRDGRRPPQVPAAPGQGWHDSGNAWCSGSKPDSASLKEPKALWPPRVWATRDERLWISPSQGTANPDRPAMRPRPASPPEDSLMLRMRSQPGICVEDMVVRRRRRLVGQRPRPDRRALCQAARGAMAAKHGGANQRPPRQRAPCQRHANAIGNYWMLLASSNTGMYSITTTAPTMTPMTIMSIGSTRREATSTQLATLSS